MAVAVSILSPACGGRRRCVAVASCVNDLGQTASDEMFTRSRRYQNTDVRQSQTNLAGLGRTCANLWRAVSTTWARQRRVRHSPARADIRTPVLNKVRFCWPGLSEFAPIRPDVGEIWHDLVSTSSHGQHRQDNGQIGSHVGQI